MSEDLLGYDDEKAIAFIRNYIPQELKDKLSDDDITYFVDLIADFYESRGYMDIDDDDEDTVVEIDEEELLDYVVKNANRDEVGNFDKDEIRFIIQAEFAYYDEIGLLED